MFYKTELLSLESNTQISVVYYVSTSNSRKKISKKQIMEFDIISATENMRFPEIPFSLRLYSYLLNGIAKIWQFKLEEYSKFLKKLGEKKRSKPCITQIRKNICPNLEIEDVYFDHISETESTNTISKPIDTLIDLYNREYEFGVEECIIERSTLSELEAVRKSSSVLSAEIKSKPKKMKIDLETTLKSNFYAMRNYKEEIRFPNLINCTIIEEFKALFEKEKSIFRNDEDDLFQEFEWSVQNSLEEVRNSNSSSNSLQKNQLFELKIKERTLEQAEWFYGILEKASQGKIIPHQNEPFGRIEIFLI